MLVLKRKEFSTVKKVLDNLNQTKKVPTTGELNKATENTAIQIGRVKNLLREYNGSLGQRIRKKYTDDKGNVKEYFSGFPKTDPRGWIEKHRNEVVERAINKRIADLSSVRSLVSDKESMPEQLKERLIKRGEQLNKYGKTELYK